MSQRNVCLSLFALSLLLIASSSALAQVDQPRRQSSIGFELDALPYVFDGYYGSVWIGLGHMRYRAVFTSVTTPDFVLEDGFTNNEMTAYTVIADYFFKPNFEKFWVGAGFEYWQAEIQTDAKLSTASYANTIFTFGGGYVWKFYRNFYLNPWAAGHQRIAGENEVIVDSRRFVPPPFTAEASLKLGWHFNLR